MNKLIKIRAHHLLCIPRFYRGGYDKKFATNMKKVVQSIRKNPDTKIKVVVGSVDVLCEECPYWSKKECIQSKEIGKWVVAQDKKVLKYLKLKQNSIHKAKDIFNLSMEKVNSKTMSKICSKCIFLDNCLKVGINNSFKNDLNRN